LDGYLQLAHIDAQTSDLTGMYVTARQLDALYEMEGNMDYYITANSFYIPHRATSNIRHFRSLYVDLDVDRRSKYSKTEAFYMLYYLADGGEIPTPSMVVDSGRGLHVYWRIEHAPMGAVLTWQAMQDYLYKQLKHLGADPQSTDSARLLRLPGTINSKNGATCQILIINDYIYSLSDLREQYLKYKPKTKKAKTKKSGEVSYIYKPYTLHMARLQDLMTLCKLRNYNVTGCGIISCFSHLSRVFLCFSIPRLRSASTTSSGVTCPTTLTGYIGPFVRIGSLCHGFVLCLASLAFSTLFSLCSSIITP
jgi:hypothetical protein